MATRALDAADIAGTITHRLSGWRGLLDAMFIAAWDDLAAQAIEPNAFNESWFLRPALEQFDPGERVQLFTLWDDNRLCGLMPLTGLSHYGRWPMPNVQNWLHHNAFLGTPLVRGGYAGAFWQALLAQIDAAPGQSLFAHFNGLDINGELATELEALCAADDRRHALVHRTERAFLEKGLSPEAYLENAVRAKKRKELRRQKNRLSEEGALTFARDSGATGLAEWTQGFLLLEKRGWKGSNGSALACADNTQALFAEALAGAAIAGKLERLDLRLDGKPLAMLATFHCAPGSFSFKTAFDEDYARFSPGVLLQIENLALLEQRDTAWCDSCASEGHPMIDSLWTGRRAIGRYSVAIGGPGRRAIFGTLLRTELARNGVRQPAATAARPENAE
jgi:hypothetical protein